MAAGFRSLKESNWEFVAFSDGLYFSDRPRVTLAKASLHPRLYKFVAIGDWSDAERFNQP